MGGTGWYGTVEVTFKQLKIQWVRIYGCMIHTESNFPILASCGGDIYNEVNVHMKKKTSIRKLPPVTP